VPQTWDDWIKYLDTLKKAGITPIVGGNKEGYEAAQYFSDLEVQTLDDPLQFQQVTIGKGKYTDPQFSSWMAQVDQLVKAGYFNDDINSIPQYQGNTMFENGQGAYLQTNTGFVKEFETKLGSDLGIMPMPRFANGKLANAISMNAQGLAITSFSPHKQEAADFLVYLHTTDRLNSWYAHTGVPFADDRFDTSQITAPIEKTMYQWTQTRPNVVLEGLMPSQVWEQGLLAAGQMIFQQAGSPADAAKLMQSTLDSWRGSNDPDYKYWTIWGGG
jgi:ABC-type glycerol-3-phosphate transport system substrate-binding protein